MAKRLALRPGGVLHSRSGQVEEQDKRPRNVFDVFVLCYIAPFEIIGGPYGLCDKQKWRLGERKGERCNRDKHCIMQVLVKCYLPGLRSYLLQYMKKFFIFWI
jgi:hypothetical protein